MSADPNTLLMKQLVARQFDELCEELAKSRSLAKERLPLIRQTLAGVRSRIADQFQTVMTLTEQMGEEGREGFLSTMRSVVDSFVKDLITISATSMRIVERVNLMTEDIDGVLGNVSNIEEMASTTRFIALNAHIEAHRGGAVGTSFRVVAEEIKRLAGDAQAFSGQIRAAVDRFQLRLSEARSMVSALASHDLNGALSAQSRLIELVDGVRRSNESMVVSLKVLEGMVESIIEAMDFEEQLHALLSRASARAARLQALWIESVDAPSFAIVIEKNRALLNHDGPLALTTATQGEHQS